MRPDVARPVRRVRRASRPTSMTPTDFIDARIELGVTGDSNGRERTVERVDPALDLGRGRPSRTPRSMPLAGRWIDLLEEELGALAARREAVDPRSSPAASSRSARAGRPRSRRASSSGSSEDARRRSSGSCSATTAGRPSACLAVLDRVPDEVWSAVDVVGERGLGGILIHQLGRRQRWRHGIQRDGLEPEPELEPLPPIEELRARWIAEWEAVDAWLPTLDDASSRTSTRALRSGRSLAHVVRSTGPSTARRQRRCSPSWVSPRARST